MSRITVFTLLALLAVRPLDAMERQETVELTGTVSDSLYGTPLDAVDVYLEGFGFVGITDESGVFKVRIGGQGPHILGLSRPGYLPRLFRFSLPADAQDKMPIGELTLLQGKPARLDIGGRVVDVASESPLKAALISINGQPLGVTDSLGTFRLTANNIVDGVNRISVRRIGYRGADHDLFYDDAEETVQLSFSLARLPYRLDEIKVEADYSMLVAGRMADFYRRREVGHGQYMTAEEIAKIPTYYPTDLFDRFAGVESDDEGLLHLHGNRCEPLIFVDGFPIPLGISLNEYVQEANRIAGIEVYTRMLAAPLEFTRNHGGCAAIVVWLK